jgi:hypothetical protein
MLAALGAFPVPPEQTQTQAVVWAAQNTAAKVASDAATPLVLATFGSASFKAAIASCCPDVANLSASALLERYRAEVRVTELCHNFPSVPPPDKGHHWFDETIGLAEKYPWFLNQWQAALVLDGNASTPRRFDPRRPAPIHSTAAADPRDAEVEIFGLPPFASHDSPTWEEAMDRLIYVAHNFRRRDTGSSFHFGDVSAIFRTSSVKDLVLIAPVDTGVWEGSCNTSGNPWRNLNCSYWPSHQVATLDHFDHLILVSSDPGDPGDFGGSDLGCPSKALSAIGSAAPAIGSARCRLTQWQLHHQWQLHPPPRPCTGQQRQLVHSRWHGSGRHSRASLFPLSVCWRLRGVASPAWGLG